MQNFLFRGFYWMKNKCLLLSNLSTFQAPLTLLTNSAVILCGENNMPIEVSEALLISCHITLRTEMMSQWLKRWVYPTLILFYCIPGLLCISSLYNLPFEILYIYVVSLVPLCIRTTVHNIHWIERMTVKIVGLPLSAHSVRRHFSQDKSFVFRWYRYNLYTTFSIAKCIIMIRMQRTNNISICKC